MEFIYQIWKSVIYDRFFNDIWQKYADNIETEPEIFQIWSSFIPCFKVLHVPHIFYTDKLIFDFIVIHSGT